LRDLLDYNPNLAQLKKNLKFVKGTKTLFFKTPNPNKIKEIFDKYCTKDNIMFNLGIKKGTTYHAISVKSYNPHTGMVTIVDPNRVGVYEEKPLKELAPNIVKLWATFI